MTVMRNQSAAAKKASLSKCSKAFGLAFVAILATEMQARCAILLLSWQRRTCQGGCAVCVS